MIISNRNDYFNLPTLVSSEIYLYYKEHQDNYSLPVIDAQKWEKNIVNDFGQGLNIYVELDEQNHVKFFILYLDDDMYQNFYIRFLYIVPKYRKMREVTSKVLAKISDAFEKSNYGIIRCSTNVANLPVKRMFKLMNLKYLNTVNDIEYYASSKRNFLRNKFLLRNKEK